MTGRLICAASTATYPRDEPWWLCTCGSPLDIAFDPLFDRKRIAHRKPTMWRYREAIPIRDDANVVSFDEEFTPLVPMEFDGRQALFQQDHLLPTGFYKDRGASVWVSKVRELGIGHIVEDSSGNAGNAIPAYRARAGVRCDVFVPSSAEVGNLTQTEAYGAALHKIPGSRVAAACAAVKAARQI